jgi:hypothetical protein
MKSTIKLLIAIILMGCGMTSHQNLWAHATATCPGCDMGGWARPKPSPPGPSLQQQIKAIERQQAIENNLTLFRQRLKKNNLYPLPLMRTNPRQISN